MDTAQDNGLDERKDGHVERGVHRLVRLTVLRKVISIVLMHHRLNAHQEDAPDADDDQWSAPKHLCLPVQIVVANQAMVLMQPLDQVVKHLKGKE